MEVEKELILAIQNGDAWIKRFTRDEYKKAFSEYCQRFAPVYLTAIRAAEDDRGLQLLVDRILDERARLSGERRFWARSVANMQEKQMAVIYLSPMLIAMDDPVCTRFAQMFRESWISRWPKQAYGIGDFTTISKSFNNTIYGTDLKQLAKMIHREDPEDT